MKVFTQHPESVGESYFQHMHTSFSFGGRMFVASIGCLLHGVFPFLCVKTGSKTIQDLHHRMVTHRDRRNLDCGFETKPALPEISPNMGEVSVASPLKASQHQREEKLPLSKKIKHCLPGTILSFALAAMSVFMGSQIGGPVMLYALALGILCHRAASVPQFHTGLSFSANGILKIGVALLGVKITIIDVANLGYETGMLVIAAVATTMIVGTFIGRAFGLKIDHAVLSAGAVAICGSSAALAISSVVPKNKDTECNTVLTIIIVTTFSTVAMVLYPLIANFLKMSDVGTGMFLGVSIHNVAQVVGAGYIFSEEAGEIATIVKLMRVACLVPVILIISLIFRGDPQSPSVTKKPPLLPLFMVGFMGVVILNSLGFIPTEVSTHLSTASQWALVAAVAALGVKTSIKDIIGVGSRPLLALTAQTGFLATFALGAISLLTIT